jgi:site-specific DNA-cytosine methylase
MNIVSYYDGMSCGQIALEKVGVAIDNYFAYEIDKYAMEITQKNYPNTKQMGSVLDVDFDSLPKIDLLIGGSPCQGFSTAGKELNFDDPRSKLFFEFVKAKENLNPEHWLLENVGMKKEFRDIISEYLGVEPIFINSAVVSGQNRPRFYWTNIKFNEPTDRNITVGDVIGIPNAQIGQPQPYPRDYKKRGLKRFERIEFRTDNKSNAIITNSTKNQIKTDNGIRKLTPSECEKLQTVPDGYTEGVSTTQRYNMLGNGWTVDVIAHIFSFLKGEGKIKEKDFTQRSLFETLD